jgi:hypothetical protein
VGKVFVRQFFQAEAPLGVSYFSWVWEQGSGRMQIAVPRQNSDLLVMQQMAGMFRNVSCYNCLSCYAGWDS